MEVLINIYRPKDFTKEEREDLPFQEFTLNNKNYLILLCDLYYDVDNLDEIVEMYIDDEEKQEKVLQKLREKAIVQIAYNP